MDSPSNLETKMIRFLTENESMTPSKLAMFCNSKEHEVFQILERWEEVGYAAQLDAGEFTLTR